MFSKNEASGLYVPPPEPGAVVRHPAARGEGAPGEQSARQDLAGQAWKGDATVRHDKIVDFQSDTTESLLRKQLDPGRDPVLFPTPPHVLPGGSEHREVIPFIEWAHIPLPMNPPALPRAEPTRPRPYVPMPGGSEIPMPGPDGTWTWDYPPGWQPGDPLVPVEIAPDSVSDPTSGTTQGGPCVPPTDAEWSEMKSISGAGGPEHSHWGPIHCTMHCQMAGNVGGGGAFALGVLWEVIEPTFYAVSFQDFGESKLDQALDIMYYNSAGHQCAAGGASGRDECWCCCLKALGL